MKHFVFVLILGLITTLYCLQAQDPQELVKTANSFYTQEKYVDAAETYQKAINTGKVKPDVYYNAACCWALAGEKDKAFRVMNSINVKDLCVFYKDIKSDKDLVSLHSDLRWTDLMTTLETEIEKIKAKIPLTLTFIDSVNLPNPRTDGKISVEKAMNDRRSHRDFADQAITLQDVSQVLWAAYGLTKPIEGGPAFLRGGLRTAPSAGALYPLDVYLVAGNVQGLPPGIYFYDSGNHRLKKLVAGDQRKEVCTAANSQKMVEQAPASLVYSAVFSRTTSKYGDRGRERYVCMDLGHSAENVYLQCEAMGFGTCAIGAFFDDQLKSIIGMTRNEEPLYIMPFGKKTSDE